MKRLDRSAIALFVLASGATAIWLTANQAFPVKYWLLWSALAAFCAAAVWVVACAAVGWTVVQRLLPGLRLTERLVVGLPLGVLMYGWAVFLIGLCGGLGTVSFFALPIVFLAVGARGVLVLVWRVKEHVGRFAGVIRGSSWLVVLAICLGVLGLVLVYVPILTPENIQHDARWYHLPIAQQYSTTGRIDAFSEGWFLAAYPHLSSLLYSWALLAPVGIIGRLLLAAHMEFALFLYVLVSIPVLVRAIVGKNLQSYAWVAFFLFPGFLVYDSNLSLGADHIAAIWAPPGLLLAFRLACRPSARLGAFLGAIASGAYLTKYSAICIVVPMLLALVGSVVPRRRSGVWVLPDKAGWMSLACGAACFVVITSQHWLKNWVSFGDPFYPMLRSYLPSHPWNPDAEHFFSIFMKDAVWRPEQGLKGLKDTAFATFAVGFEVNEFGFHGTYPTFGFLFPIAGLLAFLAPLRRARWTVILCLIGVATWYMTNHRDRYLQAILPWMVAVTFATLFDAWQRYKRATRVAVAAVVTTQILVSLDLWLLPSHGMTRGLHPLVPLMEQVKHGFDQRYSERSKPHSAWAFEDWVILGAALPKGSRVLVHEDRLFVGLNAPVVIDEAAWQGGIQYGVLGDTRAIYDDLRSRGVTHIITGRSHGDSGVHSLASELLFGDFITNEAKKEKQSGHLTLYTMPSKPVERRKHGQVLVLVCKTPVPSGVYELGALKYATLPPEAPVHTVDVRSVAPDAWDSVEYAIREKDCGNAIIPPAFRELHTRGELEFYAKR